MMDTLKPRLPTLAAQVSRSAGDGTEPPSGWRCQSPTGAVHFGRLEDTAKGNRPSFSEAAPPELAEVLYETFCAGLREVGDAAEIGVFGARMCVELTNDGPVTILLDA